MKTNIFHLQIIPLAKIFPHEEFDQSRAKPLVARLKKDGYLANPIIVASVGNEQYLQLDGMNRFSAFKIMEIPTILAQIIDYSDQETVELSSWSHLFYTSAKTFFYCAQRMDHTTVKQGKIENVGHRYIKEEESSRLCTVVTKNGQVYLISTSGTLLEKVKKLNKLVSCYKEKIVRDVMPPNPNQSDTKVLFAEHPSTNMMLVFPTFTRHQIIEVVKNGQLFPPGVTRHIIKRRCLNVNIPLLLFSKRKSLEEQNKEMEEILLTRHFRLYEEPTIYFE